MSFKTQTEIFRALMDGKKIHLDNGGIYLMMHNGLMVNSQLEPITPGFASPEDWSIFVEPTVYTMYRSWFLSEGKHIHYVDTYSRYKEGKRIRCTCCQKNFDMTKILEEELLKKIEM